MPTLGTELVSLTFCSPAIKTMGHFHFLSILLYFFIYWRVKINGFKEKGALKVSKIPCNTLRAMLWFL